MDRIEIRCTNAPAVDGWTTTTRCTSTTTTTSTRRIAPTTRRIFIHRVVRVVSPSRASRRHPSRAPILPSSYRGRISRARMHATHLREHGAGDAEGERALGHLFGEFVQTRASGDGLGGSVVRSSRARRQSSPVRSSARARPPRRVARERSLARGRSIPRPRRGRRVDDARARARRERDAGEEKFPRLKTPLRRPRTRPARASRIVEIAPRSIARPSRDRSPRRRSRVDARRLPTERRTRARYARHNTHRLVVFAALKARTLPRTADCVMDAMVVRARVTPGDARGRAIDRSIDRGFPRRGGGYVLSPTPSITHPASPSTRAIESIESITCIHPVLCFVLYGSCVRILQKRKKKNHHPPVGRSVEAHRRRGAADGRRRRFARGVTDRRGRATISSVDVGRRIEVEVARGGGRRAVSSSSSSSSSTTRHVAPTGAIATGVCV